MNTEGNAYTNDFALLVDRSHEHQEGNSYDAFNSIPVQCAVNANVAQDSYPCEQVCWKANLNMPQVSYEAGPQLEGRMVGHPDLH